MIEKLQFQFETCLFCISVRGKERCRVLIQKLSQEFGLVCCFENKIHNKYKMSQSMRVHRLPFKKLDSFTMVTSKSKEKHPPEESEFNSSSNYCKGQNLKATAFGDIESQDNFDDKKQYVLKESCDVADKALKRFKSKNKMLETLQKHEELKKKYQELLMTSAKKPLLHSPQTIKLQQEAEQDKIKFLTYNQINQNQIIQEKSESQAENDSPINNAGKSFPPIKNNSSVLSLFNGFLYDNYFIMRFFSQGISGKVYLAMNMHNRVIYSIKMIRRSNLNETNFKQLIREIKIQTYLNHPNIVKLYHSVVDQEFIYLFLQPCLGGDLYKNAKQKDGKFEEKEVKQIIKQVCGAVEYMHKNDIIHRDLKPENILLHEGVVKICDFGWAVHSPLLRDTRCGTPLYAPPEMVKKQLYDSKIDIWNIGILTYQLLFGNIPFEIRHVDDFNKIVQQQIYFSDEVKVSDKAKAFILGCVNKNPIKRFSIRQAIQHQFLNSSSQKYRSSVL